MNPYQPPQVKNSTRDEQKVGSTLPDEYPEGTISHSFWPCSTVPIGPVELEDLASVWKTGAHGVWA